MDNNPFKCCNCKIQFIGLGKFLEHKSKCFLNGTPPTIDPVINNAAMIEPTITTYLQLNDEATILNYQMLPESHTGEHHPDEFSLNSNNTIDNASTITPSISPKTSSSSPSLWSSHYHTTSTIQVNEIIQPIFYYTELQHTSSTGHNPFIRDTVIKTDFNCSQLEENSTIINYPPVEPVGIQLNNPTSKIIKPTRNRQKKKELSTSNNDMVKISSPKQTITQHKQKRIRKKPWERKRNYQCRICGRSFHENKLERHVNIHLIWPDTLESNIGTGNFDISAGIYRCNYCPERIDTFKNLRTHMSRLHKNVKLYMCPMSECRQLFAYQDLIIEHSKGCAFNSTVQCSICSQYFSLTKELDIHLLLEHRKEIGMGEGQPRPKLGVITSELTNLKNVNAMIATTIITENDIITKAVPDQSYTNNDDKGDGRDGSVKLHPNQCPICLVKYRSEVMMLKHLHTDNHKHECEICSKIFINKRALTSHLHIHRDQKAICPVCNRSFKMKKVLHVHMLTHTDRQFICDICGQVTSHKSTIAKHFRIHTNPKEKCLINGCKKVFRHLDRLQAHQEIHKKQLQKIDQQMKSKKKYKKRLKSIIGSSAAIAITPSNTNDVIPVNNKEENRQLIKKRMFHFKKNVTIPGIVVESGQITKGIEILNEYTKVNSNKFVYFNNTHPNYDNKNHDKHAAIKLKFENEIQTTHKEIDDGLLLFEYDNLVKENICEWSTNDNIDRLNLNSNEQNSNRMNLEFVECNDAVKNEYNNVSVSLEKLPDHVVNVLLKKENPIDKLSDESDENISISKLQKSIHKNNSKKFILHKKDNAKNDKNFEFVECTPIQNENTSSSVEHCIEQINTVSSEQLLAVTHNEFEDNRTWVKTDKNTFNQCNTTNQRKTDDKVNRRNTMKKIKIPKKAKSIKKQSPTESEWPTERLQLFITRLSVKTKTTAKTFECNVCGKYFKATASHLHHVQSHRVWSLTKNTHIGNSTFDTIEKIFRCPFCPETYRMHAPLRSHMAYTHHNEKVYVCPLSKCMELFTDDHQYLLHCRQCVFQSTVRCSICKRFFSNPHELTTHKIIKHKLVKNSDDDDDDDDDDDGDGVNVNNKLIIQSNSSEKGITKSKINNNDNNLAKRIYECDVCHAKFKTKILFVKHQLKDTHNHKCLYCGMQLFTLEKYNKHVRQHFPTTYAPRMCYICGKIFKSQPVLYLHISSHTKCFTCDICKKTFSVKNSLMKHVQRHSNLLDASRNTKRL